MANDPASLVVSEVFGPTFQGEGPSLGQRAAFIRLGGCNLHCSWCDTPYTWDASRHDLRAELTRTPVPEIVARVKAMDAPLTVITGGEPLLWQDKPGWDELLNALVWFSDVEIETNGTVTPPSEPLARRYNVSPKLAHAGDPEHRRIRYGALGKFAWLAEQDRAVLKVVVSTLDDVRQVAALVDKLSWPRRHAYVMPQGTTVEQIAATTAAVADTAVHEGLRMTTRLHVLAWGQERAR